MPFKQRPREMTGPGISTEKEKTGRERGNATMSEKTSEGIFLGTTIGIGETIRRGGIDIETKDQDTTTNPEKGRGIGTQKGAEIEKDRETGREALIEIGSAWQVMIGIIVNIEKGTTIDERTRGTFFSQFHVSSLHKSKLKNLFFVLNL